MQYKVIVNGKDSGIIETNYEWAKIFWAKHERITGRRCELQLIAQSLDVELIKIQSALSERLAGNEIKFANENKFDN